MLKFNQIAKRVFIFLSLISATYAPLSQAKLHHHKSGITSAKVHLHKGAGKTHARKTSSTHKMHTRVHAHTHSRKSYPSERHYANAHHSTNHAHGSSIGYVVRGHRYSVMNMRSAVHYNQVGIASWYGRGNQGHLTASGSRYNMYSMTAASKELPLGSTVRVTNLINKKTVVVTINDRGPFVPRRIIDLSYAAATQLGFKDRGTARVSVTVI